MTSLIRDHGVCTYTSFSFFFYLFSPLPFNTDFNLSTAVRAAVIPPQTVVVAEITSMRGARSANARTAF